MNIEQLIPELNATTFVKTELTYKILTDIDLAGIDLTNVDLTSSKLTGADLTNANLIGVKLWDTIGNGKEIKSFKVDQYHIAYTKHIVFIGCNGFTLQEWKDMSDEAISTLAMDALAYWEEYKDEIIGRIETNPAI